MKKDWTLMRQDLQKEPRPRNVKYKTNTFKGKLGTILKWKKERHGFCQKYIDYLESSGDSRES